MVPHTVARAQSLAPRRRARASVTSEAAREDERTSEEKGRRGEEASFDLRGKPRHGHMNQVSARLTSRQTLRQSRLCCRRGPRARASRRRGRERRFESESGTKSTRTTTTERDAGAVMVIVQPSFVTSTRAREDERLREREREGATGTNKSTAARRNLQNRRSSRHFSRASQSFLPLLFCTLPHRIIHATSYGADPVARKKKSRRVDGVPELTSALDR